MAGSGRRVKLALLLVCLAARTAFAQGCDGGWLRYGSDAGVAPLIEIEAYRQATLEVAECAGDKETVRLVASRGGTISVLATASLEKTPGHLVMRFIAGTEGDYRLGFRVRAGKVQVLDSARSTYAAGRAARVRRHYPYDWENAVKAPGWEVPVDLAIPGVVAGRLYFVPASNELSMQEIVTGPDFAEAELLTTRPLFGSGSDQGSVRLSLRQGESVESSLAVREDLKSIDDEKWGSSSAVAERITEIPFKAWAQEGYNLSPEDYRTFAKELAGSFDAVIIRTIAPERWIADIFRAQGLRVYLYQYWSAVRILDSKGTLPRGVAREWMVRETGEGPSGAGYTAPTARTGAWQMLDVRRPEVRRYFVDVATAAIRAGWSGVFYDGPNFWADSHGQFGGSSRSCAEPGTACVSYSLGRAKQLAEVRAAIRALDPQARAGILIGQRYFDQLHGADYVIRENIDVAWENILSDPMLNKAAYTPTFSADWLANEAPLVHNGLVLGTKGANPLLVGSALRWAKLPLAALCIDIADFDPARAGPYATALGEVGRNWGRNSIAEWAPAAAKIYATGPSLLQVSQDVRLRLTRSAPAIDLKHGRYLGFGDAFALSPDGDYVIAERDEASGVRYSRERFAWFRDDLYLFGNIRFSRAPSSNGASLLFHGERIGDGAVSLRSPARPRGVLADGKPLTITGGNDLWGFVLPAGVAMVAVEF